MTLGVALGRMAQHLGAVLGAGPTVGTAQPAGAGELPSVVLYATDAVEVPAGIGNVPRPPRTEPLKVTSTISLADPVVRFGAEVVPLLADGGRVLRLPHGVLVHADGAPVPPPLTAADVAVSVDGTPYALVAAAPAANQFQLDATTAEALGYGEPEAAGVVRFAAPLAGTAVTATYYIGEWEVAVSRYRGNLQVDVVAATPDQITTLSDAIGAALRPGSFADLGLAYVFTPSAWGPIGAPEQPLGGGRRRTITFRFDVELETAIVPSGGGVILRADVAMTTQAQPPRTENFRIA